MRKSGELVLNEEEDGGLGKSSHNGRSCAVDRPLFRRTECSHRRARSAWTSTQQTWVCFSLHHRSKPRHVRYPTIPSSHAKTCDRITSSAMFFDANAISERVFYHFDKRKRGVSICLFAQFETWTSTKWWLHACRRNWVSRKENSFPSCNVCWKRFPLNRRLNLLVRVELNKLE